jgi:hypothetical protein
VATEPEALPSRDELVAMVAHAHGDASYAESTLAGRTLAAQSKLPNIVAVNLGAGFGQWDFFPNAAEIVDFALAYVPPSSSDEVWAIARAWAADDAHARPTILALIGREILQHELRRLNVADDLRAVVEETRPTRARELRANAGLEVAAAAAAPPAKAPRVKRAPKEIPTRMPKPEFKRPAAPPPPPAARQFQHPKFGEGVLVSQDGAGDDAKLTIKFGVGTKTLLARFVTELPSK